MTLGTRDSRKIIGESTCWKLFVPLSF
jgi:hypothetical protein